MKYGEGGEDEMVEMREGGEDEILEEMLPEEQGEEDQGGEEDL
jgi:hypothetical protein